MVDNKIFAMHKRFGTCGVLRCRDCSHLIVDNSHKHRYCKCELYGITSSTATDWNMSFQSCGMYNVEQDMAHWTSIMYQIDRLSKQWDVPIDGQMEMEMIN